MGRLYWSIVILALGGCIGSFLNVVIYRLPRGLSVSRPRRSFCPTCEQPIAWYDNIPVLSYVLLRGSCRRCRSSISLQYPLVELATALVFLMVYDAMFVARLREGIGACGWDWLMLAAHGVLLGGLIALSVMDLEAYMVDVRVTWLITAVGIVAHTFWTPASSLKQLAGSAAISLPGLGGWIRPGPVEALVAAAAMVGLVIGAACFLRGMVMPGEFEAEGDAEEPGPAELPVAGSSGWSAIGVVVLLAAVGVYVALLVTQGQPVSMAWLDAEAGEAGDGGAGGHLLRHLTHPAVIRLGFGFVLCFVGLALVASWPQPEADTEILEAIDAEAVDARRNALTELKLLAPAIVAVLAALVVFWWIGPAAKKGMVACLAWEPLETWRPVWGLTTGLSGWVLGGAIGWMARIVFTLAFGKEALGMGDVHILAAAGAVAGWPVALLGFFLAAPLALLAIVVIALRRQSRALPYGPWLALAFFMVCLFQDVMLRYLRVRWLLE